MKKPNQNFLIFLILTILSFVLLIFPNTTGAKDVNMLAVFEIDEFAQFPHFERMLTAGENFYQTIRNFVVYLHYFYGYPFYFLSALVAFPIRLCLGSNWYNHTQLLLTFLRQMISVLPMLGSIGLWLSMVNAFRSSIKTILGFFMLISIPALFENFFWWHPDSLAFLFVSLTFFFLKRDDLSFKRNFWFSAITAGLAIGTKHLGEFFILTIPLYLIYGVIHKKISLKQIAFYAAGFVTVMIASIIISNPLLLLPIERGEIIRYQIMQFQETTQGSLVAHQSINILQLFNFTNQHGLRILTIFAGLYAFYLGIYQKQHRLFTLLLVSFLIPYGIMVFGGSSLRPNYLIPFFVPFLSCFLSLLPDKISFSQKKQTIGNLFYLIVIFQIAISISYNFNQYQEVLNKEKTSLSIQFYKKLSEEIPSNIQSIAKDWQVYVPNDSSYQVYYDWNNLSYQIIETYQPDLIILDQSLIQLLSGKDQNTQLSENVDGSQWLLFYQDADQNTIEGYHLILSDQFGKAFLNDNFQN